MLLLDGLGQKKKKVLCLTGIGGIGKTTLAAEVMSNVTQHSKKYKFKRDQLQIAFPMIAKAAKIPLDGADTIQKIRNIVMQSWEDDGKLIYLLFDNIDKESYQQLYNEVIHDLPPNVKMIITTRDSSLVSPLDCEQYEVPLIEETQAVSAIKDIFHSYRQYDSYSKKEIEEFLKKIDGKNVLFWGWINWCLP